MATTTPADGSSDQRLNMVNCQLRTGDVADQAVLAAFLDTPRELFVAPDRASLAYLDRETLSRGARSRKLLLPLTLARLLQAADVAPGERALDVGGGAGYGAALLAAMGAKVTALESDAGAVAAARELLAGRENVNVVQGPLPEGVAADSPFDVIVIEGAFRVEPDALIAQLADGGRLVGIDAISGSPQGVLYEKRGGGLSRRALFEAAADVLDGFEPVPSFVF